MEKSKPLKKVLEMKLLETNEWVKVALYVK